MLVQVFVSAVLEISIRIRALGSVRRENLDIDNVYEFPQLDFAQDLLRIRNRGSVYPFESLVENLEPSVHPCRVSPTASQQCLSTLFCCIRV